MPCEAEWVLDASKRIDFAQACRQQVCVDIHLCDRAHRSGQIEVGVEVHPRQDTRTQDNACSAEVGRPSVIVGIEGLAQEEVACAGVAAVVEVFEVKSLDSVVAARLLKTFPKAARELLLEALNVLDADALDLLLPCYRSQARCMKLDRRIKFLTGQSRSLNITAQQAPLPDGTGAQKTSAGIDSVIDVQDSL